MNKDDIYKKIKENYPAFSPAERKIADYLTESGANGLFTAQTLASAAGTSPSAVIRFVHRLGLGGLTELKVLLGGGRDPRFSENETLLIGENAGIPEIVSSVAGITAQAVNDVQLLNPDAAFADVAEILSQAEKIYLFGIVGSGLAAEDLYIKLRRIGKQAVYDPTENGQLLHAFNITPKDAALFFSYSGETGSVVKCAQLAKARGAKTVAVTGVGKSRLTTCTDRALRVPRGEHELRIGALQSRTAQLFIADILFLSIASRNLREVKTRLAETKSAADRLNGR